MFWNLHIFVTFAAFATWENVRRKVNVLIFMIWIMRGYRMPLVAHNLFNSIFLEIWLTETALDSRKPHVTKKIISQELKHVSPSWNLTDNWYSTITLPLASHKQSFSIYCQSSPFRRVFAKVLLKWQLHVFLNHNNLYIHGIRV